jgi:hypothetical protein
VARKQAGVVCEQNRRPQRARTYRCCCFARRSKKRTQAATPESKTNKQTNKHQAAGLLQGYVASANSDASEPVVRLAAPDELRAAFDAAGVPMALEDGQAAVGAAALTGAYVSCICPRAAA